MRQKYEGRQGVATWRSDLVHRRLEVITKPHMNCYWLLSESKRLSWQVCGCIFKWNSISLSITYPFKNTWYKQTLSVAITLSGCNQLKNGNKRFGQLWSAVHFLSAELALRTDITGVLQCRTIHKEIMHSVEWALHLPFTFFQTLVWRYNMKFVVGISVTPTSNSRRSTNKVRKYCACRWMTESRLWYGSEMSRN